MVIVRNEHAAHWCIQQNNAITLVSLTSTIAVLPRDGTTTAGWFTEDKVYTYFRAMKLSAVDIHIILNVEKYSIAL